MKYSKVLFRSFTLVLVLLSALNAAYCQDSQFDWKKAQQLYPGIKRVNLKVSIPRKMNINCLQIDTKTRGLKFYTTQRYSEWAANTAETRRQPTRKFILNSQNTDKKIVAAINCDAFSPWPVPYNQDTITNLLGLAVSEGTLVSPPSGSPSFMIKKDGSRSIGITDSNTDVSQIDLAVSGFGLVMQDGNVLKGDGSIHPRTGIGLSKDTRYVYFITIDGRQALSVGATTDELGEWLKRFGADSGINLDGGGSTTMAWWDPNQTRPDKSILLNVPVGGGPNPLNSERFNGNNLGVYFEKNQQQSGSSKIKNAAKWAIPLLAIFFAVD